MSRARTPTVTFGTLRRRPRLAAGVPHLSEIVRSFDGRPTIVIVPSDD